MNKQSLIIVGLVAIVLVLIAIIGLGLVYIFFVSDSSQENKNLQNSKTPISKTPTLETPTPKAEIPEPTPLDIESSDVISLSLSTSYKGFFEADSKCRKTYNELFGNKDGVSSDGSACRAEISFERNGQAVKSVVLNRYNPKKQSMEEIEKSVWKAKITEKQFDDLANFIINEDYFKTWIDGMTITVSNASIIVDYKKDKRQILGNMTDQSLGMKPLMDAFKEVKIQWKKTQ